LHTAPVIRAPIFNADGSQLAVACQQIIQIWDLRWIREQLSHLGLDWDLPPYPGNNEGSPRVPLAVKVDMGHLAK